MKQAFIEEWRVHCFLKDLYKLVLNLKFADLYKFFSKDMDFYVVVGLFSFYSVLSLRWKNSILRDMYWKLQNSSSDQT